MFDLNEFMDNRGIFKMVTFGNATLEVVSLGQDLIAGLKTLPTHEMMVDYVCEHGLAHRGVRISEGDKAEALLVAWQNEDMKAAKADILNEICELSNIESILNDKMDEDEAKELAELQAKEDKLNSDEAEAHEENENLIKKALLNNPDISLEQIESDVNAHNNAA